MGVGVEVPVGPVNRIARRIIASGIPLREGPVRRAAAALAPVEAPLAPGVVEGVVAELVGLGPLEALLRDPDVTDVLVNAPDEVWVERAGALERTEVRFSGAEAVVAAVERAISPLGLRIDRASPAVDARLADGSRLHAVIPPAAVDGPVIAIRRFRAAVSTLGDMVACGSLEPAAADLLEEAVADRKNLLVSGNTGSGKTTLLNVLSRAIPASERVVTVEDSAELRLAGHVVRLEARPPNAEGAGEITLRTLVRHAMRMRPDRIVVGEVRGPEAFDLVMAMNTGHSGSMGTVHANGPEEALWRLETLALSGPGGVPAESIRRLLESAVEVVVHMDRRRGRRRVAGIAAIDAGSVVPLWA